MIKEALLYKSYENYLECYACARRCKIPNGLFGFCGVRYNLNGKLYLANYGIFISIALDPIEKKPLYHFYPGHTALSFGTTGCSFACAYCQNWEISQRKNIIGFEFTPEEIINLAKKYKTNIITFTYNEPSIYSEFAYDVAKLAKKKNIKITWVSNGYLTDEAIDFASKFLDAIDIDIKGNLNKDFARKYILINDYEPTLQAIKEFHEKGVHVEITDLIIPEIGDNIEDAKKLVKNIYDILGENANIHFLRFYPEYKLSNLYPTPIETLEKHIEIAKEEGINYVYIGNVPGHKYENTYCPNCKRPVIKRYSFYVYEINLDGDRCKFCGSKIFLKGDAKISEIVYPKLVDINKKLVKMEFRNGKFEKIEV